MVSVNVGRLRTNCYLVDDGRDGVVVVDPGDDAAAILRAARDQPIRAILVTHYHADHVGALNDLLPKAELGWFVSEQDARMLAPDRPDVPALAGIPVIDTPPARLVHDGDVIEVGALRMRVIATPGHTPGRVVYVDDARNMAYTGDTLFAGGCGRCDLYGGDAAAMRRSLARLAELPEQTQVLPGHGRTGVIAYELMSNHQMRAAIGKE